MSDLISRSKLIDYFYFGIDDEPIIDGISDRKIIDIIKNQPTAYDIVKRGGVGKDDDMSKEEICEKVRSICKEENVEFLFITEGKSCWSVSKNEHIRKVAHFHKENENKCATDREEVKGNGE